MVTVTFNVATDDSDALNTSANLMNGKSGANNENCDLFLRGIGISWVSKDQTVTKTVEPQVTENG